MPKPTFDTVFHLRLKSSLSKRMERIAEARGCGSSDVGREAILTFVAGEEERLGIATLAASKARPARKRKT